MPRKIILAIAGFVMIPFGIILVRGGLKETSLLATVPPIVIGVAFIIFGGLFIFYCTRK